MPISTRKFVRGKVDILSLFGVGFLTLSLIAIVGITSNPLKTQLIGAYAKGKEKVKDTGSAFQNYVDSKIRQRERTGACVGKYCVAEDVIKNQASQGNQSNAAPSAQTAAEQDIIDTYNKAVSGDTTALDTLKKNNASLAKQAEDQKAQNDAQALATAQKNCEDAGNIWNANGTCSTAAVSQPASNPINTPFSAPNMTECKDAAGSTYDFAYSGGKCTLTQKPAPQSAPASQPAPVQPSASNNSLLNIATGNISNQTDVNQVRNQCNSDKASGQLPSTSLKNLDCGLGFDLQQYALGKLQAAAPTTFQQAQQTNTTNLQQMGDCIRGGGTWLNNNTCQPKQIATQPTTTITVTPQQGLSIKMQTGGICLFPSDCESGNCSAGTCKASAPIIKYPQITMTQLNACTGSGGQIDLSTGKCAYSPAAQQNLDKLKSQCQSTQGCYWDAYTNQPINTGVPGIINTLTFGQFSNAVGKITELNQQYNSTYGTANYKPVITPGGFNDTSANLQLAGTIAKTTVASAPVPILGGAALAFGGELVVSTVTGAAAAGVPVSTYVAAQAGALTTTAIASSPLWLQQTIQTASPYVAPVLTVGTTVPFAVNQTVQCGFAGSKFDSPGCASANEQSFYAAVGLQQMQDLEIALNSQKVGQSLPEAITNAKNSVTNQLFSDTAYNASVNDLITGASANPAKYGLPVTPTTADLTPTKISVPTSISDALTSTKIKANNLINNLADQAVQSDLIGGNITQDVATGITSGLKGEPALNQKLGTSLQNAASKAVNNFPIISDEVQLEADQAMARSLAAAKPSVEVPITPVIQVTEKPNLLGFEWKGFTNIEGKFQFPIGKITASTPELSITSMIKPPAAPISPPESLQSLSSLNPEQKISTLESRGIRGIDAIAPDASYPMTETSRSVTTLKSADVSAINSEALNSTGGEGLSVDQIRSLMKSGQWDPTAYQYAQSPIIAYRLPDGSIYIQSGRHRVEAYILEGIDEIPNVIIHEPIAAPIASTTEVAAKPTNPITQAWDNFWNKPQVPGNESTVRSKLFTDARDYIQENGLWKWLTGPTSEEAPGISAGKLFEPKGNSFVDGMEVIVKNDGTAEIKSNLFGNKDFVPLKAGETIPGVPGGAVIQDSKGNFYLYEGSLPKKGDIVLLSGNSKPPNFLDNLTVLGDNTAFNKALAEIADGSVNAPTSFEETAKLLIDNGYNPKNLDIGVIAKFSDQAEASLMPLSGNAAASTSNLAQELFGKASQFVSQNRNSILLTGFGVITTGAGGYTIAQNFDVIKNDIANFFSNFSNGTNTGGFSVSVPRTRNINPENVQPAPAQNKPQAVPYKGYVAPEAITTQFQDIAGLAQVFNEVEAERGIPEMNDYAAKKAFIEAVIEKLKASNNPQFQTLASDPNFLSYFAGDRVQGSELFGFYQQNIDKHQLLNCNQWAIGVARLLPGLHIVADQYPFQNGGAFGLADPKPVNAAETGCYSDMKTAATKCSGDLQYNIGGNISAFRFTDYGSINKGDSYTYGQHFGVILDKYFVDGKYWFLVTEANSPKGNIDGQPQTYIVSQDDFASRVNDLSQTYFLRLNKYNQGIMQPDQPDQGTLNAIENYSKSIFSSSYYSDLKNTKISGSNALQTNLNTATSSLQATNMDQVKALAANLGGKGAYKYDYGENLCGPLSAQILKNAGILDQNFDINGLYFFNPTTEQDKLNKFFPTSKFEQTNLIGETNVGSYDWKSNPLQPGDFLYLKGKDLGKVDTYDHMLVVDEVDSQGRVYSTTNYTTDGGKTHLIEKILLYDPNDPTAGMFYKWSTLDDKNQYGNTGHDGFILIRPSQETINQATGNTTP